MSVEEDTELVNWQEKTDSPKLGDAENHLLMLYREEQKKSWWDKFKEQYFG